MLKAWLTCSTPSLSYSPRRKLKRFKEVAPEKKEMEVKMVTDREGIRRCVPHFQEVEIRPSPTCWKRRRDVPSTACPTPVKAEPPNPHQESCCFKAEALKLALSAVSPPAPGKCGPHPRALGVSLSNVKQH